MAVDMFIKIGDLKGESKDKTHKEEFDVIGWSWGLTNSGTAHTGGGAGSGKVSVHDLSFTKYVDKGTPDLMLACCNGKHFEEAKLTVRKSGENPLEYIIITLTDLIVTNVTTGGTGGEDRLTENIRLNFAKVKVEYTEQTAAGGEGAKPKMTWNVAENVKE